MHYTLPERLVRHGGAMAGWVVGLLVACQPLAAQPARPSGSVVLLNFENPKHFSRLRVGKYTKVEPTTEAHAGKYATRITFLAVPEGVRDYPAVILENEALPLHDFTPFEAISLWVKNPGPDEAELALAIWDKESKRSFPIPSTFTIKPGPWQQIVGRLVLTGIDAKQIGSVHFYQKANRRPVILLLDDIQLLSPLSGRLVAQIQTARQNLSRARSNAAFLGATKPIESKIAELSTRLDQVQDPAKTLPSAAQRTLHLMEVAKIAAESQELASAIVSRNNGRDVRLFGPHVEASWLSDQEKVQPIRVFRIQGTHVGDEIFSFLAPAQDLDQLLLQSKNISGHGLEKLSSLKLHRLLMNSSGANDQALRGLGKFRELREIQLTQTNVTGGVLKHLEGLSQLKTLGLGGTGVADAGFSEISKLTSLESLDLERAKITGPSLRHLAGLTRLKSLDLKHTKIDDDGISHLGSLSQLESLALAGTPITGASFGRLKSLRNLAGLNLNGTRVGDAALRQLASLPKLKQLELSSTRITDASLKHMLVSSQLEYLDLYGTNITDAGMAYLSSQLGMQALFLGGTRISDVGIGSLANLVLLQELDLSGTQITDQGLKHLDSMANLNTLNLRNTRLTGSGLIVLERLPKLRELDLSGTSVDDQGLASLVGMSGLQTLRLGGTRITSEGLRHLRYLRQLVYLDLEATAITDKGLELLGPLPNLQRLNLSETNITDVGVRFLKPMAKLRSLNLSHTRITDEALSHLGSRYLSLELTHTRITDRGVEYLQSNDQLTYLRLASTGITNDALKLLQAIPNLQRLDLAECPITDAGLEHLLPFPSLHELNLNGTRVSDAGIDSLLKLASLQHLSLENARLTSQGKSLLQAKLPELELDLVFPWVWGERWSYYSLHKRSADAQALVPQWKELASLGYLHLEDSLLRAEVLRSLKDLPTLEHLSFHGSSLSDDRLGELLGLSQVARLDLGNTPITDRGLVHLQDMQGLRELSLEGTRVIGEGFVHLANLSRLQSLSLRGTPLKNAALRHFASLRALRKLELGETTISDAGVENLQKLPKLEYLDLYATDITDAGLLRLSEIPTLRYCYVSNTAITDAGTDSLRRLPDLEELGLDGTQVTDQGLAVLRSLPNLRRLRISRTHVTDAGLLHLAGLPSLSQLELDQLPVTDAGLEALQGLSKLQSLSLAGTRITDKSLASLAKLPALVELNVRDTAITEPALSAFQQEHPEIKITTGRTASGYSAWAMFLMVVYCIGCCAICFYGTHRYWLAFRFLRDKHARIAPEPKSHFAELPRITVQLPLFNERHVAHRILEAACALDYPRQSLQIQVLDDSTDESAELARRCCERLASIGHPIEYHHRAERTGFKGGALASGLMSASGELIAIFDADFVPPTDILQQIVHHFTDPQIGMVQAEWSHLNRHESLLTECQAIFLDGHFLVEQTIRSRTGRWFNFNGTAGVWRKSCIEDAGGWQHDTLTEDTDLSYRAQLKGWKFLYLPSVRCPGELPSTMPAFLGQQHRWTKGLIQTGKKLLPRILLSKAPWPVKLEAWFHLTSPVMYLVMFLLTAIALPAMLLATPLTHRALLALGLGLGTLGLGTLAAVTFYTVSQCAQGLPLVPTLLRLPALMALGIGLCAVNARAVVEALLGVRSPFVRTPKFGGRADYEPDPALTQRRLGVPTGFWELLVAGVLLACLVLSFVRPYTLIGAPFLLLFALGYGGVGLRCFLDRYRFRQQPELFRRLAIGFVAIVFFACVSGLTLALTFPADLGSAERGRNATSVGLDLTTASWKSASGGAIQRVYVDRDSLVLTIQLDAKTDQGEIFLDLKEALQPLGNLLNSDRQLSFRVEFPSRFTGEIQAFVQDGHGRREYGSMEFIEPHDTRQAVNVALRPHLRVPPMGYQDKGFDPSTGAWKLGLKISAQSDRVRGPDYRAFRGTLNVVRARIEGIERTAHPEPEIRAINEQQRQALPVLSPREFLAGSGVDRPWPIAYGFSGPLAASQRAELERTYAAIARHGCRFTRVYLGDYRTGLEFDPQGKIAGVEPEFLDYLDQLAEIANRHGITVMFSLTDNTMANGKGQDNAAYLRSTEASDLFIHKVLVEIVKKLEKRQVIWDIFNEPENATTVPLRDIQHYVDRVLASAKRAVKDAKFTVVSRSRPEIIYWQGRGLDLYSHNIFTERALEEALAEPRLLDAPIMVAEMAPELATSANLASLRKAGYSGVGIWGWGTDDKYRWKAEDLVRIVRPLLQLSQAERPPL